MQAHIQQGGGTVVPFPARKPSQSAAASLGTAQCPCCASALRTTGETVIAVNGIWLTWRQRECTACGHNIETTEIPATLAINALKGLIHA